MSIQNREQQGSEPHIGDAAMVLPFAAIDRTLISIVGGKAANLGELTRAGLPVPPGFCVTTAAYALVAAGADLEAVLEELAATRVDDTAHLAALATTARASLLAAPVPTVLAEAITEGYRALGSGEALPVAVRSSATAEDLPYASFAGQQDTYLNIVGVEAVLDAVQRVFASLWTDRAASYRASNRIDHRTVRLAVVVQRMVDASVAGVLFTANPLTGRRRQTVIDASPGLGEAIVSGAVNPDHFVVNTTTGEIIERRLGDKRLAIRATPGGGTQRVELADRSSESCLSEAHIHELAALGARVEEHYGAPQDTEFAIDTSGHLWLTQARPITTLFPLPAGAPRTDDVLRVYFSMNVAQGVYRPFTPMGLSAFRVMGSSIATFLGLPPHDFLAGPSVLTEAASRLFVDVTAVLRTSLGRTLLGRVTSVMEARSSVLLRQLEADPRLSLVPTPRWQLMRTGLLLLLRTRAPLSMLQAFFRPAAARARVRRLEARLRTMGAMPVHASAADRLATVERLFLGETPRLWSSTAPVALSGLLAFTLAGRLLRDLATGDERQTVLRGLPYNPTTEMDLSLWALARLVQADPTSVDVLSAIPPERLAQDYHDGLLPPMLQQGLANFLRTYGHRAIAEIDLGLPRWSEDPTHILGVLANYLQLKDPELAPVVQFLRGAQEAEAMVAELTGRATRKGWLRGRLVRYCLGRVRALNGLREIPKFYAILLLARLREILWPVGEELVRAGRLEAAEGVFFITLPEARAALAGADMRSLVRERHASYEHELARRHIPRILLSDGTEPTAQTHATEPVDGMLRGTPASAGSVTAKARVILDPTGARLSPGEILVAPSTDPGWTPLFLVAGGLVMEMGGAMSHGAVVAREYGIPAVVGVPEATERISTGQQITVDGSAGTVSLEEERS
jgi:phosphohistidine swiveling domain-containing protein